MNAVVLLAIFATPIVVGAVIGWWQWFLPRHRLNRIFADCKRVRLAREAAAVPPVVSILTVLEVAAP